MGHNPTATDEHYHGDSPLGRRNSYLATAAGRGAHTMKAEPEQVTEQGVPTDLDAYATGGRYEYVIDGETVQGKGKAQEALAAYLAKIEAGAIGEGAGEGSGSGE